MYLFLHYVKIENPGKSVLAPRLRLRLIIRMKGVKEYYTAEPLLSAPSLQRTFRENKVTIVNTLDQKRVRTFEVP